MTISEAIADALRNETAQTAKMIGVWSGRQARGKWAIELRNTNTGERRTIATVPAPQAQQATTEAWQAITKERKRLNQHEEPTKRSEAMDSGNTPRAHTAAA